jgi:hypothetical protein
MNKDILILIGIGAGIFILNKKNSVNGINGTKKNKKLTEKELTLIASDYAYITSSNEEKSIYRLLDNPEILLPIYFETIKNWEIKNNTPVRYGSKFYNQLYSLNEINGTRVDLFEDYEKIPVKIQKILDNYEKAFIDGSYKGLTEALNEVRKHGYTFEFYLDGQAYGLRPINVPLRKLKGYEDM